ncbi:hypothetical protein [Afipia carboxidovorans]|uniref:hypothetical protein n=1 Tax=Afipia carboxidovorans TaxID=40137 RepID=UPI003091868F|nr:hypothetical protein CRBSH125_35500 [Afipia carboxidovorans]
MRYVVFAALGMQLVIARFQIAYSRMTQAQRWQALCFAHIAAEVDCADYGYRWP